MDLQIAAPPASRAVPAVRKGAARPAPARSDAFSHLTLDGLRDYRRQLSAEEGNVSYWRRILQARIDVLAAGSGAGSGAREVDPELLRPVLASDRVGAGRRALVEVLPVDDIPPLPQLAELWDRRVDPADAEAAAVLQDELRVAETQLSEYRAALHRRITDATNELIARYKEQPALCLTALPLRASDLAVPVSA